MGCASDFCPPRPTFFSGQLITADDLNAVMTYFKQRDAMFAKMVAGWGVYGGMRLGRGAAKGSSIAGICQPDFAAEFEKLVPSPGVVKGTTLRVSAGTAIDNAGHALALCAPLEIDIRALAAGLPGDQVVKDICGWFGDGFCDEVDDCFPFDKFITASDYWVIAEHVGTPVRPMPRFAGGQACDAGQSCDFSRVQEDVRIRLVKDLPALYFLHGCLDPLDLGLSEEGFFTALGFMLTMAESAASPGDLDSLLNLPLNDSPDGASEALTDVFSCDGFTFVPQIVEFWNQMVAETCCSRPAVALGRVLLATSVPNNIRQALGDSDNYVFFQDGYPYRRTVMSVALNQTFNLMAASSASCDDDGGE